MLEELHSTYWFIHYINECATSLYTRIEKSPWTQRKLKVAIDYFDQHRTNKFEKMVEIDGFLGKYKSPKLMIEKI